MGKEGKQTVKLDNRSQDLWSLWSNQGVYGLLPLRPQAMSSPRAAPRHLHRAAREATHHGARSSQTPPFWVAPSPGDLAPFQ